MSEPVGPTDRPDGTDEQDGVGMRAGRRWWPRPAAARRRPAAPALAVALTLAATLAVAGCDAGGAARPATHSSSAGPVHLTFGVYGPPAEIRAFRQVVARYDAQAVDTEVSLTTWRSRAAMLQAVTDGARPPDLFLAARDDIDALSRAKVNQPVFALLDERGVDFGDEFSHTAIEGFSSDNDLQCMPYDVSPLMIYYNTDLVDFAGLAARGLDVPVPDTAGSSDPSDTSADSWTFAQFSTVARAVARLHPGVRGVDIRPTLRSLAPFVASGGGQVFDSATSPTGLSLEGPSGTAALQTVLGLLRARRAAVDPAEATASPERLFAEGKVAMIEGFRSLTPALRKVAGLHFDVMPMPTLGTPATTGDLNGICLARGPHVQSSADVLSKLIDDQDVATLARTGYVVPADQSVARQTSTDGTRGPFLQPRKQPAHAALFNSSVDSISLLPLIDDWGRLDSAVQSQLTELVTSSTPPDLATALPRIDELSRPVLDPTYTPSPDPSGTSSTGSDGSSSSEAPTDSPTG